MIPRLVPLVLFSLLVVFPLGTGVSRASDDDIRFKPQEKSREAVIKKVISAEMIMLETGERIRLIGIRAPDLPSKPARDIEEEEYSMDHKDGLDRLGDNIVNESEPIVDPIVSIEQTSLDTARVLMEGEKVRLEFDKEKNDENLITQAYVFRLKDNVFINAELVRLGMAHMQIRSPNTKYVELLRQAYREARQELRGLQGQ